MSENELCFQVKPCRVTSVQREEKGDFFSPLKYATQ